MKKFMDDSFLLSTKTAEVLYNEYAKDMPIIDYHCHLSPQEIYENKTFKNITEAWLYGDHYKWRVMRANGIDEKYITGDADDYEKFLSWAKTVPLTIGNPLYNWTHLELQRFFGIRDILNEKSAPEIWEKVNAQLAGAGFGARDIIQKFNVEVICTTDDPVDSLEYHQKIKADETFDVQVLPSFRPDKGLNIRNEGFREWVEKLASVSKMAIADFDGFLQAMESRIDYFHENGCRVSDHALDEVVFEQTTKEEAGRIFTKALAGEALSVEEEKQYKSFVLVFLGEEYAKRGWAMQYHMKALRNTNKRMFDKLGPDTGFDSINDGRIAVPLSQLLNALAEKDSLPKTILYSLNPTDNYVIAAMAGNFQGGIPGKIQFGTAWWFNDQKDGMLDQMKALANLGLFGRFIGMLTDSRSFLSYTRHEYFRRLMCDLIGSWVENGEVPDDMDMLGEIVQGICYYNAKNYFQFDK
ncbi:glucuronate isomerase [Siminovitchia sp. 179-K 8D1 HS]|uniref:glucuronate isomerase n=1 Tax=Siminovitchia sp. 179-K 8D1 HS TaxID=3142385 RepID=UPI0039A3EA15